MKVRLRTIGLVIALLVGLAIAGVYLFAQSGIYNVAATKQHTAPVFRLLEYAQRRSVTVPAADIEMPNLEDARLVRRGERHYRRHCLQCHGAPGVAPDALAFGMNPAPVNLVSTARDWPIADIYWVVRNGIKATGMPAWQSRLSEREMWETVGFVRAMAAMSPMEYAAFNPEVKARRAARPGAGSPGALPGPPVLGADDAARVPGSEIGNVQAGRQAMGQYLCATCHEIPGVTGANRHVGPPLTGMAGRRYIAGIVVNTPDNMMRWLRDPQALDPLSAMPDLGVSEEDARNITAYLYTLEGVQ